MKRWVQLLLGDRLHDRHFAVRSTCGRCSPAADSRARRDAPELQITFSILIVVQTFLSPWQGVLVDRFGPRLLLSSGVLITGLSWILAAQVSSLTMLYLTYGLLGGIGTGIVYVGVIGTWCSGSRQARSGDRLVAAGYGIGALLTTFPIATVLRESTYQHALTRFGVIFGVVGLAAAQGLRRPDLAGKWCGISAGAPTGVVTATAALDVGPSEMLGTRIFWLMFAMMTMMSTTGLMVTSQMGAFTRDFGMGGVLVFGAPLLPLALSLDRITNGATRPFFGWLSDRYGRENTMLVAFALEGTAMTLWLLTRENPVLFVLLSGWCSSGGARSFRCFRPRSPIRSAPARDRQLRMSVHGAGRRLGARGPVAALLHQSTGSWIPVFVVIIAMDFTTAALAIGVLKPWRRRWLATVATRSVATVDPVAASNTSTFTAGSAL
jgi:MFS family permease